MPKKRLERGVGSEVADGLSAKVARRVSNNAYMRRWRADAKRRESERARRMVRYYERKGRKVPRKNRLGSGKSRVAMCAICSIRRAVRQVSRLRVSEVAASGFEEVQMAYCGEC